MTVGLALALGRRASPTLVRAVSTAARVQALFDGPLPDAAAAFVDDEQLVLARTVAADGKGSARIGGQISTVWALGELAPELIEVHGQHQTQRLLGPSAQTRFLDRFVGSAHLETLELYRDRYRRLGAARAHLAELAELARDREREMDLLAYQVCEIEDAQLGQGEAENLEAEERRLAHAERLAELAGGAAELLGAEAGAGDLLASAKARLVSAAEIDPGASDLAGRAGSVAAEAAERGRDARGYAERLAPDPERLEAVRRRLHLLKGLLRKYGDDEAAVLEFHRSARSRLASLSGLDDERAVVEETRSALQVEVDELAGRISRARAGGAPSLAAALGTELRELGMPDARLEIALEPLAEPGPAGRDRAELRFAPGSGQQPLPLAKTASGGELSRVMLACRSVLADVDEVPTVVFDEVDAGIGGQAGVAVGSRLARLAASRQVIVVTHLPQIASFADRQIRVEKRAGTASVVVLDDEGRVEELSRMLSGLPETESSLAHAGELLAQADLMKAERPGAGR